MWDSRNPAKVFRTMNNLCCQARNVIRTHLLTVIELEELEQEASHLDATAVAVDESGTVTPPEADDPVGAQVNETILNGATSQLLNDIQHSTDNVCNEDKFRALVDCINQSLNHGDISPELISVFDQLHACLLEIGSVEFDIRHPLLRVTEMPVVKRWLSLVNDCIRHIVQFSNLDLLQCDCLVYSGALTVVRLSRLSDKPNSGNQHKNGWCFRLQSIVQNLRAHLSQLVAIRQSTTLSAHLQRVKSKLFRIYQITDQSSVLITIESLKQRIVAFATRLRRYKEKLKRHWQN